MTEVSSLNLEQPLVSIGIPTYNRPENLRRTLECATSQTYKNLQIIVSDNASPSDGSEQTVREFMDKDSRISYFKQSKNIGAMLNFQFVLDKAEGKYFSWFADDDLCDKNFVSELVLCMEGDPSIVLAMSDVQIIAEDDSLIKLETLSSIRQNSVWGNDNCGGVRELFFKYPTSNIFFCIYGLYRTKIAKACPLHIRSYRNYLFSSEVPFLAKIAVKGKIVSIPRPLKLYRTHAGSWYIQERVGVTRLGRLIRDTEIRLNLLYSALSNELKYKAKINLCVVVIKSWVKSYTRAIYRLLRETLRN